MTNTKTTSAVRAAMIVAGFALLAAGCSKSPSEAITEKLIESQTDGDVDVDLDNGDFSVKTEDGSFSVDEDGNFVVTDEDGQVVTGQGDGDGNFSIDGDDGSFSVTQGTEIPDEWPSDVPTPDGLTVTASSVFGSEQGDNVTVTGTAGDFDSFTQDYAGTLESAGFAKDSEFTSDGTFSAYYTSDAWQVSFGATDIDGVTNVSITIFPTES